MVVAGAVVVLVVVCLIKMNGVKHIVETGRRVVFPS